MFSAILALSLAPAPDVVEFHLRSGCHGQVARTGCHGALLARQRVVTRTRTVAYAPAVPAPVAVVAAPAPTVTVKATAPPVPMTPAYVYGPRPVFAPAHRLADVLSVFRLRGGCAGGSCGR